MNSQLNRTHLKVNRRTVNAEHSFSPSVRWLAVLPLVLTQTVAGGATLRSDTLAAWEAYLQAAHSRMQERLKPGRRFLSIDETEARAERIREGEPFIFPFGRTPQKVPSGLIHDWVGIAFIPNANMTDVLSTVRDYEHYSEFYHPAVVNSKGSQNDGPEDRFSMLLMNRSLFSKMALDGDYETSYVRVDDHRWYSISNTTRIQEIENYRGAQQHMLPENEGAGIIWKLSSITLFEERDGGVYVELEAFALSRDIPLSLRWIATPIVRRVSKNSLLTSLQQTADAVSSRNLETVRLSASARRTGTANALNSSH